MPVTITLTCPHCQSDQLKRNGHTHDGRQRYRCNECGKQHREHPRERGYTEADKQRILNAYQERSSARSASAATRSPRGSKKAESLPKLNDTLRPPPPDQRVLELDELWSFVYCKKNQVWLWVALCALTRQVVAFVLGDRSAETCRKLWREIPRRYKGALCYSDFWERPSPSGAVVRPRQAYRAVIPSEQHVAVGKDSGKTNHVERWNNTLRQRVGQFVRKTLSFSKREDMHEARTRLFVHRYNLDVLARAS
jgi:insertion element IS1 protein InsB